jgi:uncharacterized spore protein YtfJ
MKANKHALVEVLESTVDKASQLCRENPVMDQPTNAEGITVVPVSKISIGIAGGAGTGKKKASTPAGTGISVSRTPLSLVVIKDGKVELMNAVAPYEVKHSLKDTLSKGKVLFEKLKSLKNK